MKVLITGATGFVGSWLTKKLLDQGYDVRVISRSGKVNFDFPHENLEVVIANVNDLGSLVRASENVHTIFHLAGVVGYTKSMRQQMYQTNVLGTANVIEAYKQANCQKLVHMSSVVAVGASLDGRTPLNEESQYNVKKYDLGYFETKRAAEEIVHAAVTEGVNAVIVNPSTIYGPGDATKGSRSTQVKVARGKFPFYTSGGVSIIHIDDLIDGVISAWQRGIIGQRYILSGENITIKDLFIMIAEEAGVKPPSIYLPDFALLALGKLGDLFEARGSKSPVNTENARTAIMYHWFDNTKATREIGLKTRPARAAIADSVAWMKSHQII